MSTSPVYNIPAKMVDAFRGRSVIIRSSSASEIAYCLWRSDLSAIRFIQLLSIPSDSSILEGSAESLPLEVVLKDPEAQYHKLYALVNLLDTHPIRIAIPAVHGFSKAAKLAISLNFAVRLELDQPDEILIEELESLLDFYLRRSYVRQPIEFFHTMLRSFYLEKPISLWEVAEEDPEQVRYITENGEETISRRFAGVKLEGGVGDFVNHFRHSLIAERRECHNCEFFNRCGGYFKWPDKNYRCDGIKRLFSTLSNAIGEVNRDLASYDAREVRSL